MLFLMRLKLKIGESLFFFFGSTFLDPQLKYCH